MADEMRRRGYRTIALVSDPKSAANLFASQLATAAVTAGIRVTPVDGSDASAAVARLQTMVAMGERPAAIVFVESAVTASTILKKLRPNPLFATLPAVGISEWSFDAGAATGLGPGWYLAPDGGTIQAFSNRFSKAIGGPPTPEGALAYDLIVLAAALPQLFPGDQPYRPEVLTNSQGFVGVTGKFWFTPDGQVHRNLSAVELSSP
jgi:ABC-type branched-subunit amino acid transport system substrate-binding protein